MGRKIDLSLLGWDKDEDYQELWISIQNWQYKIFVESFRSHRTIFQFEGVVPSRPEGLKGLKVTGDIEVPKPPPDNRGFLHLVNRVVDPFLGVTLYCNNETYQELFRVFSAAFANIGGAGLQLHLKKPADAKEKFWKTGWQERQVDISHFGIYIGGHRAVLDWVQENRESIRRDEVRIDDALRDLVKGLRADYESDPGSLDRLLPPHPFDEHRPATFVLLHRMLVVEAKEFQFKQHDGLDLCHATLAAAYGSLVTLDKQWKRRVENLPTPNRLAKVYYRPELDQLVDLLETLVASH